jgi:peptide-methionine (S)-S-oxide reductase
MPRSPLLRPGAFVLTALFGLLLLASRAGANAPSTGHVFPPLPTPAPGQQAATFAGGCFWSMQKAFDGVPGVASVTAGYAGGTKPNPTYEEVETGRTGHAESVEVIFDPAMISYERLLDIYWHHIDPLTVNQAFCDRGPQYRSIIFYHDSAQRQAAEASKRALDRSGRFRTPVVTAIERATPFYPAEEYHQMFYKKNPAHYNAYRVGCRRDERLRQLWGDSAVAQAAR